MRLRPAVQADFDLLWEFLAIAAWPFMPNVVSPHPEERPRGASRRTLDRRAILASLAALPALGSTIAMAAAEFPSPSRWRGSLALPA